MNPIKYIYISIYLSILSITRISYAHCIMGYNLYPCTATPIVYTEYNVPYTMYMYNIPYIECILYTIYNVHISIVCVHNLYSVYYTMYNVQYTMYSIQ